MENELIEKNRGLVKSIVSQFNPKNANEFDDLEQAGLIGLMKAIRKYNPSQGKLTTYAYYYIVGEIKNFVRQEHFSRTLYHNTEEPAYHPYIGVTEYMDNLSDEEQIIVNMRLEGYTFTEIAKKLSRSSTSVHDLYKKLVDRIVLVNE